MSEILRYNAVITRKPHICFGCGRKFQPPCKMISAACADGGTVYSYYLCETCNEISSEMHYWDEYGFGDFRDEALERENAHVCDFLSRECGKDYRIVELEPVKVKRVLPPVVDERRR